jgi:hypothetical protein
VNLCAVRQEQLRSGYHRRTGFGTAKLPARREKLCFADGRCQSGVPDPTRLLYWSSILHSDIRSVVDAADGQSRGQHIVVQRTTYSITKASAGMLTFDVASTTESSP